MQGWKEGWFSLSMRSKKCPPEAKMLERDGCDEDEIFVSADCSLLPHL